MRHRTIVIASIGDATGRTVGGSLVNTTIGPNGAIADVGGIIQGRGIEGVRIETQRSAGGGKKKQTAHVEQGLG